MIKENHVLIHKEINESFWTLPGGRVEFFEHSDDTVVREMEEELGLVAKIERPLMYVENFFKYKDETYHEISTFYQVDLTWTKPIIAGELHKGVEEDIDLVYQWVPLEELNQWEIQPKLLQTHLLSLPEHLIYIKSNEVTESQ